MLIILPLHLAALAAVLLVRLLAWLVRGATQSRSPATDDRRRDPPAAWGP